MSTCRARLRDTSNALTLRMSGEQIRLQVKVKAKKWGGDIAKKSYSNTERSRDRQTARTADIGAQA